MPSAQTPWAVSAATPLSSGSPDPPATERGRADGRCCDCRRSRRRHGRAGDEQRAASCPPARGVEHAERPPSEWLPRTGRHQPQRWPARRRQPVQRITRAAACWRRARREQIAGASCSRSDSAEADGASRGSRGRGRCGNMAMNPADGKPCRELLRSGTMDRGRRRDQQPIAGDADGGRHP